MYTLEEALAVRVAEKRMEMRARAEKDRAALEKIAAAERLVERLVGEYINASYDAEIAGVLSIKAVVQAGGEYRVTLKVDDTDGNYIELHNPVRLVDEVINIVPLRHTVYPEWKAVHEKFYFNTSNLLDAILYTRYGDLVPEMFPEDMAS